MVFEFFFCCFFGFVSVNKPTLHSGGISIGRVCDCGCLHWWQVTHDTWYFVFYFLVILLLLMPLSAHSERFNVSCMHDWIITLGQLRHKFACEPPLCLVETTMPFLFSFSSSLISQIHMIDMIVCLFPLCSMSRPIGLGSANELESLADWVTEPDINWRWWK